MEKLVFRSTERGRLDDFLRLSLPPRLSSECGAPVSNSKIRRLILSGSVFVNGSEVRRPAFELRGRSVVSVKLDRDKFFYERQPDDADFVMTSADILFEDDDLVFVNKPAFVPVEQTITGNRKNLHDAAVDFLWKRELSCGRNLPNPPYLGIMHRLDRETSGVILFTKNRAVNKPVSEAFQGHALVKRYRAVVCKNPLISPEKILSAGQKFTVEKYIGRISAKGQPAKWGSLAEERGGLFSRTGFEVTGTVELGGRAFYELECTLFTGRTHQIRVHLSELGLPILGDELYDGESYDRLMLHSCLLEIMLNGKKISVSSPCPWHTGDLQPVYC